MTLTQDRRTELLGGCPLFAGVRPEDLAAVGERALEVDFAAQPRHRPPGRDRDGPVRDRRAARSGRARRRTSSRVSAAGDFFGEMSVIDGLPRVAQVVDDRADPLPGTRQLGVRAAGPRPPHDRPGDPARPLRPAPGQDRAAAALSERPPRSRRPPDLCRPARSPSSSPTSRARPGSPRRLPANAGRPCSTATAQLIRAAVAAPRRHRGRDRGRRLLPRLRPDGRRGRRGRRRAAGARRRAAGRTTRRSAVRMGIHTGDGRLDADGSYVGADVHRAARVAAAGHGGQVLLSETTSTLVADELPAGVASARSRRAPPEGPPARADLPARHRRPADRVPADPLARPPAQQPADPADQLRRAARPELAEAAPSCSQRRGC